MGAAGSTHAPNMAYGSFRSVSGCPNEQALVKAVEDGDLAMARRLLDAGVSVNCRGQVDSANFMWFAKFTEVLNGACTPLHLAAAFGKTDVVGMLVQWGADLAAVSENGDTPLHMAATVGETAVAQVLVERRAHLDAVNRDGFTPLALARARGKAEVASFLEAEVRKRTTRTDAQKTLASFQQELSALRKEFAGKFATKQELSNLRQELQDSKTDLLAARQDLESNLAAVKQDLERNLSAVKQDLERKLSAVKQDLERNLAAVKQDLESNLAAVKQDLERNLAAVKQEVETAFKKLKYLREDLDRLDRKPAFFSVYKATDAPTSVAEIEEAVESIVRANGADMGAGEPATSAFLEKIKYDPDIKPAGIADVAFYGSRLWTSDEKLVHSGVTRAFYQMLNQASRRDPISRPAVVVQKAINSMLISRTQRISWPQDEHWVREHKTWRGAYIDGRELLFWQQLLDADEDRRWYRAVSPLSTSLKEMIAIDFILDAAPLNQQKVLFEFQWKGAVNPCLNARYIEPFSAVSGEDEMMLTSFSVFRMEGLVPGSPTDVWQHKIILSVERDNAEWPEYLPFTKWH